jgi:hypothetical protein
MSESRPRQFVKRLGRGAHYQEPNSVHLRSFGEDASVAISLVGRGYEKSGFDLTSYQGVMKSTQYRPRPAAILVLSARAREEYQMG